MNKKSILKMHQMESTYWWHIGKRNLIKGILLKYSTKEVPLIADIGCGTGGLARELLSFGNVYGFDTSKECIEICKAAGLKNAYVADATKIMHVSGYFDFIISSDVAEHVRIDTNHFNEVYRLLKKDGCFIITVPAHKFLWSEHDESLQHFRRYTRYELIYKLKKSGFKIEFSTYTNFFIFPLVFIYRMFSAFFVRNGIPSTNSYINLPDKINNFLVFLLKVESWLILKRIYLPLGVSLLVVCTK